SQLLGSGDFVLQPLRKAAAVADQAQTDVVPDQAAGLALQSAQEQLHQLRYFARRPLPVLAAEGKQGQRLDAQPAARFGHHTGGLHPFSVTGVTRQGACLGPATVAVHDDGHMLRQDFGPDDGFSVLVAAHYSLGSWPQELGVGWNVRQGPRKANRQNSIRSFSFSSSSASTC